MKLLLVMLLLVGSFLCFLAACILLFKHYDTKLHRSKKSDDYLIYAYMFGLLAVVLFAGDFIVAANCDWSLILDNVVE